MMITALTCGFVERVTTTKHLIAAGGT